MDREKLPYSDSRPFYPTNKFAKKVIAGIENNKDHISVFSITKIFLLINYLFPIVGDLMVEKLSTWKKIKEKIMISNKN